MILAAQLGPVEWILGVIIIEYAGLGFQEGQMLGYKRRQSCCMFQSEPLWGREGLGDGNIRAQAKPDLQLISLLTDAHWQRWAPSSTEKCPSIASHFSKRLTAPLPAAGFLY